MKMEILIITIIITTVIKFYIIYIFKDINIQNNEEYYMENNVIKDNIK